MDLGINELLYNISGGECESLSERDPPSVGVFGKTYHQTKEELVDGYRTQTLEEFIAAEKRYSCGNYVLVDHNVASSRLRLITSPGYAGGYYYLDGRNAVGYLSTNLDSILRQLSHKNINLDTNWGIQYIKHGLAGLPPQHTPFNDIYRIPPGSIIRVGDEGLSIEDYLFSPQYSVSAASNLSSALSEVGDILDEKEVSLMFSGGRDSLALYLSLREKNQISNSVKPVTVDWRPESTAQGPFESIPIAEELDMDLDIVDFSDGWPTRQSPVFENVLQDLSRDLVGMFAPHHALGATKHVSSDIIAHGQNMDAIAGVDMSGPQSWKAYINRGHSSGEKLRRFGYLCISIFLTNMQYTDSYLNSNSYRRAYVNTLPHLFNIIDIFHPGELANEFLRDDVRYDTSKLGTLHSIARKTRPNIVPTRLSTSYENELESWLTNTLSDWEHMDTSKLAKLVKYYTYVQSSNKTLSGLDIGDSGRRVSLLPMWGPISSYFHQRNLGVRDAVHPKRELNNFIERKTGKTYSQLRYPEDEQERRARRQSISEHKQETQSVFVDEFLESLGGDQPIQVPIHNQEEINKMLTPYIENLQESKKQGSLGFERCQRGHRVFNLSSLINENAQADVESVRIVS
ncbi:hypothetical protein [Halobacterium salinarum]|uniref:hypothetical protein n=1 Tax=Halobacterium salinarum TaxID=2242 RepID=UPI002552BAC1|nr:hypothetical protein [Halobacterium salinarum]MDL0132505.1 hypothetical protein [Halobacterium salinarum]